MTYDTMGKMRAGEGETEKQEKAAAATTGIPDAKKRRVGSPTTTDGASSGTRAAEGLCDDVVGNILARVPARTAVASMALSKQHRRLIRSPEFRSLHRCLAPPLPRPHIAYLVTATLKTRYVWKKQALYQQSRNTEVPASKFQGFHVAGAGGFNGNAPAPMRSLAGPRFSDVAYINTCNGVVLLAAGDNSARCRCILWNPAVADAVEEVSVPDADVDAPMCTKEYRTLGLGYGKRSKTYKLILLCCCRKDSTETEDSKEYYSLVTYALADLEKQPTEVELPVVRGRKISRGDSLYMDGKIYLLISETHLFNDETGERDLYPPAILVFDVDDETVTFIDLPIVRQQHGYLFMSGLMELSGRPCVVTRYGGGDCTLWLLSVDHQWHWRCLIGELRSEARISPGSIIGVWDCGGVLVVSYGDKKIGHPDRLFLYDTTTSKMFMANLEGVMTLGCSDSSDLALCWGYRSTLEAPSSVIGKIKQDKDGCRECSTYIKNALKPVAVQDRKKGQKATLNTVCFMDFLVRIMEKLPKDIQQVLEMKMVVSDDPDFTFENVLFED